MQRCETCSNDLFAKLFWHCVVIWRALFRVPAVFIHCLRLMEVLLAKPMFTEPAVQVGPFESPMSNDPI